MHCYASYTQENGYRNNQILQADGKENKFLIGAHQLGRLQVCQVSRVADNLALIKQFPTDNTLPLAVRFAENHSFHRPDLPLLLNHLTFTSSLWLWACPYRCGEHQSSENPYTLRASLINILFIHSRSCEGRQKRW